MELEFEIDQLFVLLSQLLLLLSLLLYHQYSQLE